MTIPQRFTVEDVLTVCSRLPEPGLHASAHGIESPWLAATIVPIVELNGEAAIVATKRPTTMVYHRDDWVFPGGRFDAQLDTTTADTAIREAKEELGVPAQHMKILGQLDSHGPIVTGFIIDVFIGLVTDMAYINPDPREVAEIAIVPLAEFLNPERSFYGAIPDDHDAGPAMGTLNKSFEPNLLHYIVHDSEHLWGTQGNILTNLLDHMTQYL